MSERYIAVTYNGEALGNVKVGVEAGNPCYSFVDIEGSEIYPPTDFNPQKKKPREDMAKELRKYFPELPKEDAMDIAVTACLKAREVKKEENKKAKAQEDKPEENKEPDIDYERAEQTLSDPNILERIFGILDARGYKKDHVAKIMGLYTCLSAFSDNPQNLFFRGPPSSGKSFAAKEISKLFPDENVWVIGRMSPTAIYHQRGEYDKERGVKVIDLRGKILVFLESVPKETMEVFLPILSHDSEEISFRITEKNKSGQHGVKEIILKGWPATIFCTSRLKMLEDVRSRSLQVTPELGEDKVRAAKQATANNHMLLEAPGEKEIGEIKEAMTYLSLNRKKILIPFAGSLAESNAFPDHHEEMRTFNKYLSMVTSNTILHALQRPEITGGVVLSTEQDYYISWDVFRNIAPATRSGVPSHVEMFYDDVLVSIEEDEERTSVGIIKKYRELYKNTIGRNTYYKYIELLENAGWVYQEPHPDDKRKKMVLLNRETLEKSVQKCPTDFSELLDEKTYKNFLERLPKKSVRKFPTYSQLFCGNAYEFRTEYFYNNSTLKKEKDDDEIGKKSVGQNRTDFSDLSQQGRAKTVKNALQLLGQGCSTLEVEDELKKYHKLQGEEVEKTLNSLLEQEEVFNYRPGKWWLI